MKESIIFSGMLEVLACMIIMMEPHAATYTGYDQIWLPGSIIEGWHQGGENHHRFEKRLVIGRNHPYDRYSSTRLFWPDEKMPRTTTGRITFFKCINQTPNTTRTLMHVIRGGMGTPELELDVMYAPVSFMLIHTMIITCDVYTTEGNIVTNEQPLPWNPFNITKIGNQIPAVHLTEEELRTQMTTGFHKNSEGMSRKFGKLDLQITKVASTTQKTMKRKKFMKKLSKLGKIQAIKTPSFHNEATSRGEQNTTAHIKKTAQKVDRTILPVQKMDRGVNKKFYTDGPGLKTSSKYSNNENINRHSFSREKVSEKRKKTTLKPTSSETVESTSQKSTTSLGMKKVSSSINIENSNTEKIMKMLREKTSLQMDEDEKIKKNGLSGEKTHPETGMTTLKGPSPETVESSATESVTIPMINKVTSRKEDKGLETKGIIQIPCGEISLGKNQTNLYIEGISTKINSKDLQGQKGEGSTTEEPITKLTKYPNYNLILKFVPIDLKKKIGLAKITYG